MNIYVLSDNLGQSATHLDDKRIVLQINCLYSIIYNSLCCLEKEYSSIINYSNSFMFFDDTNKPWKEAVNFKCSITKHSTIEWANKSILHLYFLCDYIHKLRNSLTRRHIKIPVGTLPVEFNTFITYIRMKLCTILPAMSEKDLYQLRDSLYRNTPNVDEPDTILAYQKYLINHWKQQLVNQKLIDDKYALWKGNPDKFEKPRPYPQLRWYGTNIAPSFAKEELHTFKKELYAN